MCFGSERDTSPARLAHRFTRFWAQNQTKRSKEKKTKETQMAARLRGEEEKEQESMQAAEVQEGRRSGALAAGAAAAPAGSSKASFGPSSSMRGCRPVPVRLQVFPSQEGRPPGIPEKGQCLDSIQQAQKCPSLKCRRRPSQRFLDFTLGGFKRLLRVSEGGTHAGWRAGEPLILDQSQCPSLIRPVKMLERRLDCLRMGVGVLEAAMVSIRSSRWLMLGVEGTDEE